MPRSRGTELPQRQSPRGAPQLRVSSVDSDPAHHRPVAERSPKVGDRRSPRGSTPQSDGSLNQKKLGSRIADLETQLVQAQDELKNLKEQLASAEAAKKEAQEELEKKSKKQPPFEDAVEVEEKHSSNQMKGHRDRVEAPEEQQQEETDVYEVPMEKVAEEPKHEFDQADLESKERTELPMDRPEEKLPLPELALKDDEIRDLRAKLEEMEKEVGVFGPENELLKNQLSEATLNISTAKEKEEEMNSKLNHMQQDLEASRAGAAALKETLECLKGEKEELESEMKKLRVQTEQWRKAADAAAAVLAGGVEMNGRLSDRCSSMDKHFGGYAGFVGSPAVDFDDGFGSGKRKSSGIKMFGELWRKKGQK